VSQASTWAIVPVKALGDCKQRLAAVLPAESRRRLMLAMLEDVLAMLRRVEALGQVLVVTPDAAAAQIAEAAGAMVLREARGTGHSAAVVAGFAHARAHGAARALTLPADVPLATAEEIDRAIAIDAAVVLVPSRDGDGTNALLASPTVAIAPSFGPGSFARHLAQAAATGIACRTLRLPGLGLDIDEPADLHDLIRRTRDNPRYAFLAQHALLPAGADQP
jgi:2-phospho-L-lactate/phosphoenolpyruvate guanylyltransferase